MMRRFLQLPDAPLLELSYLLQPPWDGVYIRWMYVELYSFGSYFPYCN
jgi:hypothetical protein